MFLIFPFFFKRRWVHSRTPCFLPPWFRITNRLFISWKGTQYKDIKLETLNDCWPGCSHFLSEMLSSWAHLLKIGSLNPVCLFLMWHKIDLNVAHIIRPSPLLVVSADQYKWFSIGLIHSPIIAISFSFAACDKTFQISERRCYK